LTTPNRLWRRGRGVLPAVFETNRLLLLRRNDFESLLSISSPGEPIRGTGQGLLLPQGRHLAPRWAGRESKGVVKKVSLVD